MLEMLMVWGVISIITLPLIGLLELLKYIWYGKEK